MADDDDFPRTGMSLAALRKFVTDHSSKIGSLTTSDVCEQIVKEETKAEGISYVELLRRRGQAQARANVFVSHAWRYKFAAFVDAVLQLERTEANAADLVLWIDVFGVNQHKSAQRDFTWWSSTFKEAVRDIGHTVLVLSPFKDPIPLTRAWCLFEIYSTVETGARLDIRLAPQEDRDFLNAIATGAWRFKEWVTAIDLARAQAWSPTDLAQIMDAVKRTVGIEALNSIVLSGLRAWIREKLIETAHVAEGGPSLWNNAASMLGDMDHYQDSEVLLRKALDTRMAEHAADGTAFDDVTLHSMSNMGVHLYRAGQHGEALQLLQRTLEGFQVLGKDEYLTLRTTYNMGMVLHGMGRLDEAAAHVRTALTGYRRVLSSEHDEVYNAEASLAVVLKDQGRYRDAEPLYRSALAGLQRVHGRTHPDTLNTAMNLANFLKDRQEDGDLAEAQALYEENLEVKRQQLGPEHRDTLTARMNAAVPMCLAGQYAAAQDILQEVYDSQVRVLGAEHPETCRTMSNLAECLRAVGRAAEGEALLRRLLGLRRAAAKAEGWAHGHSPEVLTTCRVLAHQLEQKGVEAAAEALALYREVLEGWRRTKGPDHPEVLQLMPTVGKLAIEVNQAAMMAKMNSDPQYMEMKMKMMMGEVSLEEAHGFKEAGAKAFKQGEFSEASDIYPGAARGFMAAAQAAAGPGKAALLALWAKCKCNEVLSYLKLEQYVSAKREIAEVLAHPSQADNVKALYLRAKTLIGQSRFDTMMHNPGQAKQHLGVAKQDLLRAVKLEPSNPEVRALYNELRAKLQAEKPAARAAAAAPTSGPAPSTAPSPAPTSQAPVKSKHQPSAKRTPSDRRQATPSGGGSARSRAQGIQGSRGPAEDLWAAAASGDVEKACACLAAGADVNAQEAKNGQSALHMACHHGKVDVVKLLVEDHHADVNVCNKLGDAPLRLAAGAGAVEALPVLLAAGADVEHRNAKGQSALFFALKDDDSVLNGETVRALLRGGADPNERTAVVYTDQGDTKDSPAIMIAAARNHADQVRALLETGTCDVNAQSEDGDTALKQAAAWGHTEVVRLLLQAGAEREHTDRNGRSVFDVVQGNRAMLELLLTFVPTPATS